MKILNRVQDEKQIALDEAKGRYNILFAIRGVFLFFILFLSACGAGGTEVGNPGSLPSAAYSPVPNAYIPDPSVSNGGSNPGGSASPGNGDNVSSPSNAESSPPPVSKILLNSEVPGSTLNIYSKAESDSVNFLLLRNTSAADLENINFLWINLQNPKSASFAHNCPRTLARAQSCVLQVKLNDRNTSNSDLEIHYEQQGQDFEDHYTLIPMPVDAVSPVSSLQVFPSTLRLNQTFILSLKIQNFNASSLYNTFVDLEIPEEFSLIASSSLCDLNSQTHQLLCKIGNLSGNSETNLRFSIRANQTGIFNSQFQILSPNHVNETGENIEINLNVVP